MLCFQPNATGDIFTARKTIGGVEYTFDVFREFGFWIASVSDSEACDTRDIGGRPMPTSYDAGAECMEYARALAERAAGK